MMIIVVSENDLGYKVGRPLYLRSKRTTLPIFSLWRDLKPLMPCNNAALS